MSEQTFEERVLRLRRRAEGWDIAFLIVPFSATEHMDEVAQIVADTLAEYDIRCFRSDQVVVSDDLWENIRAHMHAADYGVAIYERIDTADYNPNVTIEVGYMMALGVPLCLLKERRLARLPSDIVGKLYYEFDILNRAATVCHAIRRWAASAGLIVRAESQPSSEQPRFVVLPPGVGPKSLKRLLRPLVEDEVLAEDELRERAGLGAHSFSRHLGYLRATRLVVQVEQGKRLVGLTSQGKAYYRALTG